MGAKPPAVAGPYKIVEKEDNTTKVIMNKQATKPKNVLMPGTGSVIGSLNGGGRGKSHDVRVMNPTTHVVNNNVRNPHFGTAITKPKQVLGGGASQEQKWRCKVCKFANPVYILDEEGNIVEPKTLLEKCLRCRDPKQVLFEEKLG